jgi:hypothetical protein
MTAVWSFLLLDNFQFLIVSYINAYKDRVTHAQTRCCILVEGAVWNGFSCLAFFHHSSVTHMLHVHSQSAKQISRATLQLFITYWYQTESHIWCHVSGDLRD